MSLDVIAYVTAMSLVISAIVVCLIELARLFYQYRHLRRYTPSFRDSHAYRDRTRSKP